MKFAILLLLAAAASAQPDLSVLKIRQAREDFEGARKRIATDPEWQKWLAGQRAEVDDWMAKRQDRVEWVAGWWHDFVSPRDGSFLTWTAEEPGEYTLSSPSDPRVKLTDTLHRAWVFGFRSRHANKIEEAAALWRLTGDRKYAEWAAAQLDFYAENYERWPLQTQRNPARLMHQSLDEAVNLLKYVRAARWIDNFASAEQKRGWIDRLLRPEAELLARSLQRIHNIACWQRSAQAAVALCAKDEAMWRLAVDGEFGIRAQIQRGITDDSLWLEQSLLYNNYVVSALLPFFLEVSLAGRAVEFQPEMKRAGGLLLAPLALRFPDGKLPTPADSTGGFARAPNRGAFAAAYRVFSTPLGLEAAASQRSLATLIDPPEPAPQVVLPEVRSWHLSSSKMMLLRKNGWQIYFHYGQIDPSHSQAEALNFEAYYDSTDVTHDPGTVGYGSPLHRGFYTTPWAHNVPLVDFQGQQRWQPGEALEWKPDEGHMAASQSRYREGVRVSRSMTVEGSKLKDHVEIQTSDGRQHRLGVLLHLQGRIQVPESFEVSELPAQYCRNVRSEVYEGNAEFRVLIGGKAFQLKLRAPGEFRVYHFLSPDAPPREREGVYWEIVSPTASAAFETELEPVSASRSIND